MAGYDSKSCNDLEKPFYYPIEAAIRWCGLIDKEAAILSAMGESYIPAPGQFPHWPCLRVNTEKVIDAILHDELTYGRDGKPVAKGEQVARPRLTVRHTDLKQWVTKNFPDQKPLFLFDDIERNTHAAINSESFQALQADRKALQKRFDKLTASYKLLRESKETIESERNSLKAIADKAGTPSDRAEATYQNIIAALLDCIIGNLPGIEKHPSFASEAKLIEAIDDHFRGYGGLSKSNLSRKFPEAKRALQSK